MMDLTPYKNRVTTVRGRARAQLAAIRKERLSRRMQVRHVAEPVSPTMWPEAESAELQGAAWDDPGAEVAEAAAPDGSQTAEDLPSGPPPAEAVAQTDEAPATEAEVDAAEVHDTAEVQEPPAEPVEAAPADAEATAACETAAVEEAAAPSPEPEPAHDAPLELTPQDRYAPEADADLQEDDGSATTVAVPDVADSLPEDEGAAAVMDGPAPTIAEPDAADTLPEDEGVAAMAPAGAHEDASDPTHAEADVVADTVADATRDPLPDEVAAAEVPAESDLFQIPGIGTGLVWMMQTAGIRCLDDLARAEARDLEARLGMISRLLDLDYFIDFARGRSVAP